MSIQLNRDWVKMLLASLPEYAEELGRNIETVMADDVLDEVDAHACALAAALADGNGELAFEISMSDTLRGNDIREAVAKAVLFESMNARYIAYSSEDKDASQADININDFTSHGGTTPEKFLLFCFVAAVVNQSRGSINRKLTFLSKCGVPQNKIQAAAKIASVIPAISKCLI